MSLHATQRLHLSQTSFVDHPFHFVDALKMRFAQVVELAAARGWASVAHEMVFLNRTAIVVEKDLAEVKERLDVLANVRMTVVEIDQSMLSSGAYRFAVRSRGLKAARYLQVGYGGVALVRGNEVIGDTWYVIPEPTDDPRRLHVDLRQFGFKSWVKKHVYTFDIFLAPAERKGGISAAFQNAAMLILRSKGYTNAFGFYWADNIPAHWCTRVTNRWKKVKEVKVSRFFNLTKAIPGWRGER